MTTGDREQDTTEPAASGTPRGTLGFLAVAWSCAAVYAASRDRWPTAGALVVLAGAYWLMVARGEDVIFPAGERRRTSLVVLGVAVVTFTIGLSTTLDAVAWVGVAGLVAALGLELRHGRHRSPTDGNHDRADDVDAVDGGAD